MYVFAYDDVTDPGHMEYLTLDQGSELHEFALMSCGPESVLCHPLLKGNYCLP